MAAPNSPPNSGTPAKQHLTSQDSHPDAKESTKLQLRSPKEKPTIAPNHPPCPKPLDAIHPYRAPPTARPGQCSRTAHPFPTSSSRGGRVPASHGERARSMPIHLRHMPQAGQDLVPPSLSLSRPQADAAAAAADQPGIESRLDAREGRLDAEKDVTSLAVSASMSAASLVLMSMPCFPPRPPNVILRLLLSMLATDYVCRVIHSCPRRASVLDFSPSCYERRLDWTVLCLSCYFWFLSRHCGWLRLVCDSRVFRRA